MMLTLGEQLSLDLESRHPSKPCKLLLSINSGTELPPKCVSALFSQ